MRLLTSVFAPLGIYRLSVANPGREAGSLVKPSGGGTRGVKPAKPVSLATVWLAGILIKRASREPE